MGPTVRTFFRADLIKGTANGGVLLRALRVAEAQNPTQRRGVGGGGTGSRLGLAARRMMAGSSLGLMAGQETGARHEAAHHRRIEFEY